MKQIFTALGAMALLATACKQDGSNYTLKGGDFKLEGNIKGAANEMLIISLAGPDGGKNDSVLLRNGKFSYSAKLNEPVQVRLRLAESQQGNEMQFRSNQKCNSSKCRINNGSINTGHGFY